MTRERISGWIKMENNALFKQSQFLIINNFNKIKISKITGIPSFIQIFTSRSKNSLKIIFKKWYCCVFIYVMEKRDIKCFLFSSIKRYCFKYNSFSIINYFLTVLTYIHYQTFISLQKGAIKFNIGLFTLFTKTPGAKLIIIFTI